MAKIKDPSEAIIREPERAGVKIVRKNPSGIDAGQAPVSPKTAGADKDAGSHADPAPRRRSDRDQ